MDDLAAFLTARWDEDEQAARDATWHETAGAWRTKPTPYETRGAAERWYIEDSLGDGVVSHVDPQASDAEGVARHIARHDPASVLRDIEAKRKTLADYETTCRLRDEAAERIRAAGEHPSAEDLDLWGRAQIEAVVLRGPVANLALPYADLDDYQEGWRP